MKVIIPAGGNLLVIRLAEEITEGERTDQCGCGHGRDDISHPGRISKPAGGDGSGGAKQSSRKSKED